MAEISYDARIYQLVEVSPGTLKASIRRYRSRSHPRDGVPEDLVVHLEIEVDETDAADFLPGRVVTVTVTRKDTGFDK